MKYHLFLILFLFSNSFQSQEVNNTLILKKCRKEFNKKICLSDEDKDRILFYLDKCPKENGVVENNGCPWQDWDKDGVIDKDDACPEVMGPEENNGCPWPDTDGDGILDKDDPYPTNPNINGKDCDKVYAMEKARYEKSVKELSIIDFSGLLDIIFEEEDFKNFLAQKKKLIFVKKIKAGRGPECGNDPYYDCKHFEKNIDTEFFTKLWNKNNFNKLKKKLGDKIIVPIIVSRDDFNNRFLEDDENNYFLNNNISPYYKGTFNDNGRVGNIYYTASQKPSKELNITLKDNQFLGLEYKSFSIAILPQSDSDYNMEYLVQLIFSDDQQNYKISDAKYYRFVEGKWSFIRVLE